MWVLLQLGAMKDWDQDWEYGLFEVTLDDTFRILTAQRQVTGTLNVTPALSLQSPRIGFHWHEPLALLSAGDERLGKPHVQDVFDVCHDDEQGPTPWTGTDFLEGHVESLIMDDDPLGKTWSNVDYSETVTCMVAGDVMWFEFQPRHAVHQYYTQCLTIPQVHKMVDRMTGQGHTYSADAAHPALSSPVDPDDY